MLAQLFGLSEYGMAQKTDAHHDFEGVIGAAHHTDQRALVAVQMVAAACHNTGESDQRPRHQSLTVAQQPARCRGKTHVRSGCAAADVAAVQFHT
jgi:hypothetical protein